MDYKKIERKNYNINIIKTDRFKSVDVTVFFTNTYDKESAIKGALLPEMLTSSSNKYKNIGDVEIYTEELYGAETSSAFLVLGNTVRLKFSIDFLEPKYTEPKMLKQSLEFFKECILNSNIEEGGFNKQIFDINKKGLLNKINNVNDNMNSYLTAKFNNEMFKGFSASFNLYNEYDEFNKLTPKAVYEFYLSILRNWKIDVYLLGNITDNEEEKYIKEIDKIFSSINNNFDKNKKLTLFVGDLKTEAKEIIESSKFSQSGVAAGYNFNNLTDYERRYVLNIYNIIFGGTSNSLLFKNVREKKSLCYFIESYLNKFPISLIVRSEISKENFNKTITEIDNTLLKMKNRRYVKSLFNTAKENINTSINSIYDDTDSIILDYYYRNFDSLYDIELEDVRKKYMSVKIKDVINLNNKLSKSIIYFMRGDKE